MMDIKTFEEYTLENSIQNENQLATEMMSPEEVEGNVISEELQRKIWEYAHESMKCAMEYHSDTNDKHTLSEYLKESAKLIATKQVKSLRENAALMMMAAQKLKESEEAINEGGEEVKKEIIKTAVKAELDKAMESMANSYSSTVDEMLKENAALAAMVAADMMKEK